LPEISDGVRLDPLLLSDSSPAAAGGRARRRHDRRRTVRKYALQFATRIAAYRRAQLFRRGSRSRVVIERLSARRDAHQKRVCLLRLIPGRQALRKRGSSKTVQKVFPTSPHADAGPLGKLVQKMLMNKDAAVNAP
jgi:hypothetical protein